MISSHGQARSWFILVLISFSVFLGALDLTVVSTVLRQVIFDLEIPFPAGLNEAAWIVTGYLLAYTVTIPIMGRLSDLLGRRRVFLACLALFVLGSLVVGMANSLWLLVLGRVVQALGAGPMVPVSMAIVGDVFPEQRRAVALGVIGAVDTAGWVVGPLYGALMVTQFQWRWIFFLNIPLGIAAAALAWMALDLPRPTAPVKIDYAGAALLTIALASLTVALNGNSDLSGSPATFTNPSGRELVSPQALVLGLIFLVTATAFVLWEKRTSDALINLDLFRNSTLSAACIVNLLLGGALIAAVVNIPLFVNTVLALARRLTPSQADLQSGMTLGVLTFSMVVAAFVGGLLTERWGYRPPVLGGLAIAAAAFGLLSGWGPQLDDATQFRDLTVGGWGLGLVLSPIATATINTAAEQRRGTASALVLVMRLLGMTILLPALTAWGVYRFNTLSSAVPLSATGVEFITAISTRVMSEIFLVAAAVCVVALVPALFLRQRLAPQASAVHTWQ